MTGYKLFPVIALATMIMASCAPAGAPTPAAAPVKSPVSKPAASADWKDQWDKVVAAAKVEGKVVVAGAVGQGYRNNAVAFAKAFPDIQVEFTGLEGSDFAPKITAEREGGSFLWDVHTGGPTTALTVLRPKGVLDPLRPVLLLPDVLDGSKWLGGLDDGWKDAEGRFVFGFESRRVPPVWVNRDLVPESELSSIDQLLDPKWKGKIITRDPRLSGTASAAGTYLLIVKGEEWLRRLYSQDLVINNDERATIETVVRGAYPIIMGVNQSNVDAFQREGLGKNIKPVDPDPDGKLGQWVVSARGNAMLINRAPHPNAARVFINWLLSKDGQQSYVEATSLNSRRTDVGGPPESAPKPNVKIVDSDHEQNLPYNKRAKEIATEVIK